MISELCFRLELACLSKPPRSHLWGRRQSWCLWLYPEGAAKVSAAEVTDLQLWLCSPVAKQCSCERVHLAELSQLMRLIHVSCTGSSFRNVSALDVCKLGTRSHFPIFSKCQALTDPFSVPFSELGIKILLGLVLAWWNRTPPGQHQGNYMTDSCVH